MRPPQRQHARPSRFDSDKEEDASHLYCYTADEYNHNRGAASQQRLEQQHHAVKTALFDKLGLYFFELRVPESTPRSTCAATTRARADAFITATAGSTCGT
jgi:hypothetical protein